MIHGFFSFLQTLPPFPTDLAGFLVYIGLPSVIGFVVSIVAEQLNAFQGLPSQAKMAILLFVSFAMGAVSKLLIQDVTPDTLAALNPWFVLIVQSITILIQSQVWHKFMQGASLRHVSDEEKRYKAALDNAIILAYHRANDLDKDDKAA